MAAYVNERILVEWSDADTGQPCALGSVSRYNRQAVDLTVRTDVTKACLLVSLPITIQTAGRSRKLPFLLVFSPWCLGEPSALDYEALPVSSPLVSAAARDAAVAESGHIIRVRLRLSRIPLVVMPATRSRTVKPTTAPAHDLLLGLKSLSRAFSLTMYMKKNDYALQGLRLFCNRLRQVLDEGSDVTYPTLMQGLFPGDWGGDNGAEVDWNLVRHAREPPPYDAEPPPWAKVAGPVARDDHVLVPQTPSGSVSPPYDAEPSALAKAAGPIARDEDVLVSQTTYYSVSPHPSLHGLFSQEQSRHAPDEPVADAGSINQADTAAILDAHSTNHDGMATIVYTHDHGSDTTRLRADLAGWLFAAAELGCDTLNHQGLQRKLAALGQYVRTGNVAAFDATLAWCSALVFFDPASTTACGDAAGPFLADMVSLIRWANRFGRGAELAPRLRQAFLQLGTTARTAVQVGAPSPNPEYARQKYWCAAEVLAAYGSAGAPD